MAAYKALMPCRFCEKDYRPGSEIPAGTFPEKQAAELALMGLIEIIPDKNRFVEADKTNETDKMSEKEEIVTAEPEPAKPKRRKRKAAKE